MRNLAILFAWSLLTVCIHIYFGINIIVNELAGHLTEMIDVKDCVKDKHLITLTKSLERYLHYQSD